MRFVVFFLIFFNGNFFAQNEKDFTKYVNPLIGSDSSHELSKGNTYPAIALPWGMNFWTPQTGKMGDGGFIHTKIQDLSGYDKPISQAHGLMIMEHSLSWQLQERLRFWKSKERQTIRIKSLSHITIRLNWLILI